MVSILAIGKLDGYVDVGWSGEKFNNKKFYFNYCQFARGAHKCVVAGLQYGKNVIKY